MGITLREHTCNYISIYFSHDTLFFILMYFLEMIGRFKTCSIQNFKNSDKQTFKVVDILRDLHHHTQTIDADGHSVITGVDLDEGHDGVAEEVKDRHVDAARETEAVGVECAERVLGDVVGEACASCEKLKDIMKGVKWNNLKAVGVEGAERVRGDVVREACASCEKNGKTEK